MKKLVSTLSIVFFVILNSLCYSQWIPIIKNSLPDSNPTVKILSDDGSSTVIRVDLPGYRINHFEAEGKTYSTLSIGDEAITTETGLPEIPHIAKILAIPDYGSISVEVLETGSVNIVKGITVNPSRESWQEGKPESRYIENFDFYSKGNIYPSTLARIEDPVIFRDFRIARVSIYPIRYSPERNEIEALSSITVRVNYGFGNGINNKISSQRKIAPSFAKIYKSIIFNYDEVMQRRYNSKLEGHDKMLCIMPDAFANTFQIYQNWKQKTGTEIIVTKFSEIGATGNNPETIKNYILSAYNTWPEIPTHILLIGDEGVAPHKNWTSPYDGYTFPNEDYFVELEGNDYFPEMMIGRFTNQEDYRLQVIVSKSLGYEKTPDRVNNSWYKKGIVCSNDSYQSQVETKRYTAEVMMEDGQFISVDTMMSKPNCLYSITDVVAAINNGRSYLNYRGEGWSDGWWSSCTPLKTNHVNGLNNGTKLTFVTSIGCGVAMFTTNDAANCFGEAWVELGTPTQPRGGVAFIGPTSNTHTTYNNKIDKGIYVGMFQEGLDSPGEALLRGKMYMYNVYGNTSPVEHHFKIYCVLGDPTIHIWKDIPKPVNVFKPDSIYVGLNQIQISVTDSVDGTPINNARVCVSGGNVYSVGNTDSTGTVFLTLTPQSDGILNLTVCGGNVIPVETSINVVVGTENVTPLGNPGITDLDGNDDGLVNPNENCSITYTLRNWGTSTSNNVRAFLTIPDSITNVQIVTVDTLQFGNIAPSDSIQGSPFQVYFNSDCPVGSVIPFHLHVFSETSSWDYYYDVLVHGCRLNFVEFFIDDEGNLLRNFRMDPGETVKMKLEIVNNGDDLAPDVQGIIGTEDPYFTIIDSIGTFGSLMIDSSATNDSDYFILKVDQDCPLQYNAEFTIKLSTQNGLYPYTISKSLTLPVAMPSAHDATGPDGYGYYAYSSDDVLWTQAPQFNWAEINSIGTEIPKPVNQNDFTETVVLPFTFKYYGNDFSNVRISSDGWIAFGSGTETAFENHPLPNSDNINNMVGVFWDDLFTDAVAPDAKLLYYSDVTNNRFIIEWYKVPHVNDPDERETFQIILLDPAYYPTTTGDGEIIFQYQDVEEPASITVGIENSTEDVGLLYLFNELYDATANELQNEFAIKLTTKIPVVTDVNIEGEKENILPQSYSLEQNFPNPFNPETRIRYSLPESGFVTVKIFRIDGELVKTLESTEKAAGRYEIIWDGTNDNSNKVSSGVYFYRIQSNEFSLVKKMIFLK
jgi:hypothetical protein